MRAGRRAARRRRAAVRLIGESRRDRRLRLAAGVIRRALRYGA